MHVILSAAIVAWVPGAGIVAGSCTSGFMQLDVLRRRAIKIPKTNGRSFKASLGNEFRLIPGRRFTCNGTITSLLLGADIRPMFSDRNLYPELQIWRINGNSYRRQGRQKIKLVAGRDFSPDGVLVYNLASPMQFQSGDVLGVYQPPRYRSVVRLYYSDQRDGNDSASVSYQIGGGYPASTLASAELKIVTGQDILISPITGEHNNI